mmetsp:Transcript_15477/g.38017  ORF Transcript_15477/g.38017 Transcript_15477/m.38017 type:complete len:227 (+) Transcript_15477:253-933(+)
MSDRENVPGGHIKQSSKFPTLGLKLPAGHWMHSVRPTKGWYHPAGHATHAARPSRNCTLPGGHGSHTHEFHVICLPLLLVTWLASHTRHWLPEQHPVPRPPPAKHPSSEKNTESGFSAWNTMKIASLPCAVHCCAVVRVDNSRYTSRSAASGRGMGMKWWWGVLLGRATWRRGGIRVTMRSSLLNSRGGAERNEETTPRPRGPAVQGTTPRYKADRQTAGCVVHHA